MINKIISGIIIRYVNRFFVADLYYKSAEYCYEMIHRSYFLKHVFFTMNFFEELMYYIIPENFIMLFIFICDLFISLNINVPDYFIASPFLGYNYSSIENLIIVFYVKYNILFIPEFLFLINPYFIILSSNNFIENATFFVDNNEHLLKALDCLHLPCTNGFWFFYLNMFKEYQMFFHKIILLSYLYISSLVDKNNKYLLIMLAYIFGKSDYKNYMLLYYLRKNKNLDCRLFYILLFIFDKYITYMFMNCGSGNLNFVNWMNFIFILLNIYELNLDIFIN